MAITLVLVLRGSKINRYVVNVVGGLGNQLFQYAFGEILQKKLGYSVFFDVSDYYSYKRHEGLAIEKYFDLKLQPVEFRSITMRFFSSYWVKRIFSKLSFCKFIYTGFKTDDFDLYGNEKVNSFCYFYGYWQSQKYTTNDLKFVIRNLNFRDYLESSADNVFRLINPNFNKAAAIHIRRGDYINAKKFDPQYVLPINYYLKSMDYMNNTAGVDEFYFFSDDIEWVKNNFKSDKYKLFFVDKKISISAGFDMCLMTRFNNLILSNSTFSWWSAYLRKAAGGNVLYPKQWVKAKFKNKHHYTIHIPSDWTSIDVFE